MRRIFFILSIMAQCTFAFGQEEKQSMQLAERLYAEIAASPHIEMRHIGCFGLFSTLYKKVDTPL